MAVNKFSKITQKEVTGMFLDKMASVPQLWEPYFQEIPSDSGDETHAWLGSVPQPREMLDGRQFQGVYEYNFNVENNEYELSMIIDRVSMEDDRHGLWKNKIAEMATAWANYDNTLFAALLENGATSGYNSYDGTTFFADTHAIGGSTAASNDNNLADTIVAEATPTEAEMQLLLQQMVSALDAMPDDHDRNGVYNVEAARRNPTQLRLTIHPEYEPYVKNVVGATLIASGGSNPYYYQIAEVDVLPMLTAANYTMFLSACGDASRKPFINQKRTELEIVLYSSQEHIADNHGLKVLARRRGRMWYGEPRRCARMVVTTT